MAMVSECESSDNPYMSETEGYIQRIYSEDKLNPTLNGLRKHKVYAEDKLKSYLNGIKKNLETPKPNHLGEDFEMGIPRVSTTSTDNASDDNGSPVGGTILRIIKSESPKEKKRRNRHHTDEDTSSLKSFWIKTKRQYDGNETIVSNLTGYVWSDDEDEAEEVLSQRGPRGRLRAGRRHRGATETKHGEKPKTTVRHYSSGSLTQDEFGSIAPSLPQQDDRASATPSISTGVVDMESMAHSLPTAIDDFGSMAPSLPTAADDFGSIAPSLPTLSNEGKRPYIPPSR